MRDILNYISSNREMQESDFLRACQRIVSLQHTASLGDNFKSVIHKVGNMDIENCSFDVFVHACSILPIMTQSDFQNQQVFSKSIERISKTIQEQPEKLTVENLLVFLDVCIIYDNRTVIDEICQILIDRISSFKFRDQFKYFQVAIKSKAPGRFEKELFALMAEKVHAGLDRLDIRNLIGYYKLFKNINPKVYRCFNLQKEIETRLLNNIDELEERDIASLISFKSKNNVFLRLVYSKLIDSISEEGESSLEVNVILQLITRISESGEIRCY